MRNNKLSLRLSVPLLFLLLAFFTSCEGDVRFTTEQPNGVSALKEVPAILQGDYVSNNDSLYVRKTSISLVRPSRNRIPLSDTTKVGLTRNKQGQFTFKAGEERYIERLTKDSVTVVSRNIQVYRLGNDTVLKSFNNAYWLSVKNTTADKKTEWKVMQITLHKNKLEIAVAALPKDEKRRMQQRLDEGKCSVDSTGTFSCVTPFTRSSDQTYYIITASSDQLRNLDRRGLFRPVATFDKVK